MSKYCKLTHPAEQVQYLNIFVPWSDKILVLILKLQETGNILGYHTRIFGATIKKTGTSTIEDQECRDHTYFSWIKINLSPR